MKTCPFCAESIQDEAITVVRETTGIGLKEALAVLLWRFALKPVRG